jgi:hypothetical protein
MDSLVLAVVILASPALYGGPLALCLTLWRFQRASRVRLILVRVLAVLALVSGTFLLVEQISPGSSSIGLIGISTSLITFWRLRKKPRRK